MFPSNTFCFVFYNKWIALKSGLVTDIALKVSVKDHQKVCLLAL